MTTVRPTGLEARILVLLPLRKDALTLQAVFQQDGLECALCADLAQLCRELGAGAATIILNEEQLLPPHAEPLLQILAHQPRWSDLSVLVLLQSGTESPDTAPSLQRMDNVILLARPIHPEQLLRAARSALRARQRQYQLRDYLAERQQAEKTLRESEEQLAQANTELRSLSAKLTESELRYRSFVEATNQVIWRMNDQAEVDQPIPHWDAFTGQTPEQSAGGGWMEAIHPEDRARVLEAWHEALKSKGNYKAEYRLRRHDGQWRNVVARGVPVFTADDRLREYMGACLDVTEQRATEARVQRQAQFIELSPTATIARTLEGRITFWSAGAETLYGWKRQEALGRSTDELLRTEFPKPLPEILHELRHHGKWVGELRHHTKSGSIVIVQSHWLGRFSPEGELSELLESNLDITQRKQAEALLRSALRSAELERSRLSAVLEALPAGVGIADARGKLTTLNAAMTRIWGGAPVTKSTGDYAQWRGRLVETGQPIAAEDWAMARALRTGQPVPPHAVHIEKFDGSGTATVLNAAAPILDPAGQVIGAVVTTVDITEQYRTEEALQRRHGHLQILHQAAAELLLGHTPENLLRGLHGQIARTFGADIFLFYDAPRNGRLHLQASGGVSEAEQRQLATLRSGCAVCAKPAEALQPIIATHLQTGQAPNRRLLRKLGWQAYLYFPLVLEGRLQGTLAFASRSRADYDATDQEFFHTIAGTIAEALERHRLQSEVEHHTSHLERQVQERTARLRETVAELEGFSYSLVHDMRAPLRAMLAYAGILEMEAGTQLPVDAADLLRKITLAARRMDQLVTDSLNYSRILRQDLPMHPVNLGGLLHGIVETYPNLHSPQAEISIKLDDLTVHGNEAALTQIFSNLLGNAVKFVAPGVHPRVRVWAEPESAAKEPASSTSQTGGPATPPRVRIWVEDNGIGIPREAHEKIFGMFQRMHRADEYPGTGIGLALVKKSLERTGGEISLESQPGHGSRFCVTLPQAAPPEPPAPALPP